MRDAQHTGGSALPAPARPASQGSAPGHAGADAQTASDGPESVLAALGERVARLETDVRNLQSQLANRA